MKSKKLVSIFVAFGLVLSLSTNVFAEKSYDSKEASSSKMSSTDLDAVKANFNEHTNN